MGMDQAFAAAAAARIDTRGPIKKLLDALTAASPGLVLLTLYVLRLAALREDPSLSSGTPGETVIALMVAGFAAASFLFARIAFQRSLGRALRAFGVIALGGFAAGLTFGVVLMG
jgi:hypothetical protein